MATIHRPLRSAGVAPRDRERQDAWNDWIMIAALSWLIGGMLIDGWAHSHGRVDQSFFTPWHGVLYSGFAAVACGVAGILLLRRRQTGRSAVPSGYELTLVGVPVFAIGGLFDMLWHVLFGIEKNVDAALSPSHLLLATGMALLFSTPFRAAWRRPGRTQAPSLWEALPLLLSLSYTLTMIGFITQYAHPYGTFWATRRVDNANLTIGITSILLQTAVLMGGILLAIRRWRLPFGSLTLLLTLNGAMLSITQDTYLVILVALIGGLLADGLLRLLRPSPQRPRELRLFAFGAPALLFAVYFAALALSDRITWTTHAWTGAIALAGVTGWLLSYLLLPPAVPGETE